MLISNTMAASQLSESTCEKAPSISFGIEHILGDSVGRKRALPESIVRPWTVSQSDHHDMHTPRTSLHHVHRHHHHHLHHLQNHHQNHHHHPHNLQDANKHRRLMESPPASREGKLRLPDFTLKSRHRSNDDTATKKHALVSPLDALFKLTNTTFDKTSKSEQNSPGKITINPYNSIIF